MRRAILFRYHKYPAICRNHIALLRRFNPGMPIYGMYGGPLAAAPVLPVNHNYVLPFASPRFKWQNGDLCARQWFIDVGHRFPFDMLHIVEWDLVILQALAQLFQSIRDGVAVTDVKTIGSTRSKNWYWIATPERNKDMEALRAHVAKKYGEIFTDDRQVAGIFPAAAMSRAFLERYAEAEPFERRFINDEIRMPLFAQALGMPVHDTRIHLNNPYMDCSKRKYSAADVAAAFPRHRLFHHMNEKIYLGTKLN